MTSDQTFYGDSINLGESYWLNQFKGELPVLEMSTDRIPDATKPFSRKFLSKKINAEMFEDFKLLLESNKISLYSGLLSLVNSLLFKYTGQEDIIIGDMVTGFEIKDYKNNLNTLPLRCKFSEKDTFIDLLRNMSEVVNDGLKYKTYLNDDLINKLNLKVDKNRNPLFDLMVMLSDVDTTDSVNAILDKFGNKLYIIFAFKYENCDLHLDINYDSNLFDEESINSIFIHLEGLLKSIVENPHESIESLEYLTSFEISQLLNDYNNSLANYPKTKTIVDFFEEQVANHPAKIALTFEDRHITYAELNNRVNQLGRYLQKFGVKKDVLVPICIERSIEMIIGLLGISKAGGAYVPIDPDYPIDRINYILDDTKSPFVISSSLSSLKLMDIGNIDILKIDMDWAIIAKESTDNIYTNIHPTDLIYVIYTSGSTGMPKGVLIEHRNVVRLFKTDKPLFDFNENDVWTLFHSFTFDFSVWEMYGALLYGGHLVIVPKLITKDFGLYAELLKNEGVTILNQTPSAFYVLQDYLLDYNDLIPMRYIIFGGEALNPYRLKPWNDKFSQSRLVNMYGITETTVHVTYQEIATEQISIGKSIIGHPIPTLTVYILDKNLNLLPSGITGEIYVGGDGLARGYLNKPELTAERFIRNPFNKDPDSRLYKTGDIGRRFRDGSIEYLGRIDNQVKIRGYRIELGEIESAIEQYPSMESAIVLIHGDPGSERILISFLFSKKQIKISDLRDFLSSKLPEYMMPSFFLQIEEIPLTPNGKIDRKSLYLKYNENNMTKTSIFHQADFSSNEIKVDNSIFIRIKQIINEVCGFDIKDTHSTYKFIEMGFNSLLFIQFSHTIRKEFGVSVSFRELNDVYTTPSLLADLIHHRLYKEDNLIPPSNKLETPSSIASKSDDFIHPPLPGAKLGRDQMGNPAWFINDPEQPEKFIKLN